MAKFGFVNTELLFSWRTKKLLTKPTHTLIASTTETGDNKNILNFDDLIQKCTGMGIGYNPSNTTLLLVNMEAQRDAAQLLQQKVNKEEGLYEPFQNARVIAFADVDTLATRAMGILRSSDVTKEMVADAFQYAKKVRGDSKKKKKPAEGEPAVVTISTSQQSFDLIIDNFDSFISVLEAEPNYAPNEADLKTPALRTKWTAMKTSNATVKVKEQPLLQARIDRDKALYFPKLGLVDTALKCKEYVKGAFTGGAKSSQYKLVAPIVFTRKGKKGTV